MGRTERSCKMKLHFALLALVTAQRCKENAELVKCASCSEESCNGPIACALCTPDMEKCCFEENVCHCKTGFSRNDSGECVAQCDNEDKCGDNESWAECKSCTEESCEEPMMCVDCLPNVECCAVENKCMCDAGYVRNANGACVKKDQCGKSCPAGEYWTDCGSECTEKFCPNEDFSCPEICQARCQCDEGSYRDSNGVCVVCQGTQTCGDNSKWNDCGSACPAECGKPQAEFCTQQCVPQCECNKGFVLDAAGGCIKEDQCEKSCPAGEYWTDCGNECTEQHCPGALKPEDWFCPEMCQARCQCDEGTHRDESGACVTCQEMQTCGDNAEWNECGTACPAECGKPDTHKFCTEQCVPQCECSRGFVLDSAGNCIARSDCPTDQCPANEHWDTCGSSCKEDKCVKNDEMCADVCQERCQCNDGLVRDERTGSCVGPFECDIPSCDDNEEWTACGNKCKELDCCPINAKCSQPVCTEECTQMCQCKPGFFRSKINGTCKPDAVCGQEASTTETPSTEPTISEDCTCKAKKILNKNTVKKYVNGDDYEATAVCISGGSKKEEWKVTCGGKTVQWLISKNNKGKCRVGKTAELLSCADDSSATDNCQCTEAITNQKGMAEKFSDLKCLKTDAKFDVFEYTCASDPEKTGTVTHKKCKKLIKKLTKVKC